MVVYLSRPTKRVEHKLILISPNMISRLDLMCKSQETKMFDNVEKTGIYRLVDAHNSNVSYRYWGSQSRSRFSLLIRQRVGEEWW